jgi:hypothetical protein
MLALAQPSLLVEVAAPASGREVAGGCVAACVDAGPGDGGVFLLECWAPQKLTPVTPNTGLSGWL